jgi:hypothetical protein
MGDRLIAAISAYKDSPSYFGAAGFAQTSKPHNLGLSNSKGATNRLTMRCCNYGSVCHDNYPYKGGVYRYGPIPTAAALRLLPSSGMLRLKNDVLR